MSGFFSWSSFFIVEFSIWYSWFCKLSMLSDFSCSLIYLFNFSSSSLSSLTSSVSFPTSSSFSWSDMTNSSWIISPLTFSYSTEIFICYLILSFNVFISSKFSFNFYISNSCKASVFAITSLHLSPSLKYYSFSLTIVSYFPSNSVSWFFDILNSDSRIVYFFLYSSNWLTIYSFSIIKILDLYSSFTLASSIFEIHSIFWSIYFYFISCLSSKNYCWLTTLSSSLTDLLIYNDCNSFHNLSNANLLCSC